MTSVEESRKLKSANLPTERMSENKQIKKGEKITMEKRRMQEGEQRRHQIGETEFKIQ